MSSIVSAAAFLTGHGVWALILPYFAVGQTIFHGVAMGVLSIAVGSLVLFCILDFIFGKQFTCRYICPTGRLLGYVGQKSIITVRRDPVLCLTSCTSCSAVCPLGLWAHHFKGLPHYNYFENYPQVPEEEFLGQSAGYEFSLVVYDFQGIKRENLDAPNTVRLFLVIFELLSGNVYTGPVTLEVMDGVPVWLAMVALAVVILLSHVFVNARKSVPSTKAQYWIYPLFKHKIFKRLTGLSYFPMLAQSLSILIFLLVLSAGLWGNQKTNIGPVITWTWWWALLIFMIFGFGKAFCVICPWEGLSSLVTSLSLKSRVKKLGFEYKWPKWARNIYPAIIFFLILTWFELGWNATRSPMITAIMGVVMASLAILCAIIYEKRAFCRYVCLFAHPHRAVLPPRSQQYALFHGSAAFVSASERPLRLGLGFVWHRGQKLSTALEPEHDLVYANRADRGWARFWGVAGRSLCQAFIL